MMQQENKMGTMPENKLLLSMSVPIMISMLVQALYNIVDSIFVARISEDALTAVSLAFPIQSLMISVGVGIGVGINAVLSRALGQREQEKVNKTANNGIFLILICYILFLAVGIFATVPFYKGQTQNADIVKYGIDYLTIVCVFSLGMFIQIIFERLLQSTGKTIYNMYTQGTGAIINIILDPILIFGLFGMPELGIAGAAIATVIGQFVAGGMAVYFNMKKNKEIHIDMRRFRPDIKIIKQIFSVGFPSIVMQAIGSVMVYGMNQILIIYSSTATAVFGIYFKLQSFVFMPVFGLNSGIIPILAYNYGARKKDRMIKTMKLSFIYAIGIMLVGMLAIEIFTQPLLAMFSASSTMMEIGIPALRIICLSFTLAGFCIVCSSIFQALGNGVYSMIVSIARQLVVLLPVAYGLSLLGNVNYVWWAFPIAELMSLSMSIFFLIKMNKEVISKVQ